MNKYMKMAYAEAKKAFNCNEIPVGCVIVKNGKVIARGYNKKEVKNDCTLHAEMIAIKKACGKLKSWRLDDCDIYITLEPCMMCMGAIIESRIKNVYFGTKNNSEQMYDLNKITNICNINLLYMPECAEILTTFFEKKRKK